MTRGTLRIHLGAAPGVGKTVKMLDEGRRRAERGTDVVVAYCETHGRRHTQRALEGLEVVPRKTVTYRGADLEEMDVDAVLARAPRVALVDELAHTNVPGSGNEKRWQDVERLLDAGIDVVSTVNIQHLESLNDATYAITGVRQRETVPDAVVRAAHQLELVDMAPEALRRRMAHGNVYGAHKVDAALANYFRPGNLAALRELALLWLADRVDQGLEAYRSDHSIASAWPTRFRVVVALSGGREGHTLLRRAARIASRGSGGELHAVYVAASDGLQGADLPVVAELRRLTEELGGSFHTVTGGDPAAAVLDYARGVNASQIVIGLSRRSRLSAALRPSTGERIIAGCGDQIDVHVVTHELARSVPARTPHAALPRRRVLQGSVLAAVLPAVLTAVLSVPARPLGLPLTVQLYLLATVVVALVGGLGPAVAAGVASSLLINWFFTPPTHTLTIADPENATALLVFVGVAALVSFVVHRSARRAAAAAAAGRESAALAELSNTLLGSTGQLDLLLERAVEMFGQEGAAVVRRVEGAPDEIVAATGGWTAEQSRTVEPVAPDLDLVLAGPPVPADRQRLLSAYGAHAAAVVHRRELQDAARSADELARDSSARTALLSAVSHDLRTPLAGIKAGVGALRSASLTLTPEDEQELLEAVESSADRLEALVANLLDASRLHTGALVARPTPVDLAEVVGPAIRALPDPARVRWELDDDARVVRADPGLLDRVLGNLLENAVRFQPADAPVVVTASRHGDRVEVRVVDSGPGVPAAAKETIFRPFQRYGDAPSGDGVGLGLAVARGFADAMGGSLVAEDTPGGGVTMVVTLPSADAGAPAGREETP